MAAERRHAAAAQIGERAITRGIGCADGEDLPELVVRNRDRQPRAARGAVFDAAQTDVEVAARDRRIEGGEADLDEARRPVQAAASSAAMSTSKPTTRVGSAGSASTNGAPPSASPPHRNSGVCAAVFTATSAAAHTHMRRAHTRARRFAIASGGPSMGRESNCARVCLMREWNAETYHRVSNPQFDWGMVVLARLPLDGGECVLDVGCGTGRLTEQLLARLPLGRVIGIDQSTNMVSVAREYLKRHGDRLQLLVADAAALPIREEADAVFSTATFHWVLDHPRLFRSLHVR